jgi:hypothetical protein
MTGCDRIYNLSGAPSLNPCLMGDHVIQGGVMAFNATFKNISVISWQPVLLMEEIPLTCHSSLTNLML